MPEMYGTHHSKIVVLFRHDDLAQVILLTANFIERDWRMSQAIWKTPLLPIQEHDSRPVNVLPRLGSGPRFKHDLLAYFRGYGPTKLQDLVTELREYDFTEVRGALVASLPGKQTTHSLDPEVDSLWGWPGLKRILSRIPSSTGSDTEEDPHIVSQISSVAAVGEKWLKTTFIPALCTSKSSKSSHNKGRNPKISIIFPTIDEIRRSIDGYASGSSIHMKTSTPAQSKQLSILRPMLCHWAGEPTPNLTPSSVLQTLQARPALTGQKQVREAGRRRAAPHIKTYARFSDTSMTTIDWAMMTSANLSTQAWGAASSAGGEIRICSYEAGVVLWPALWDNDDDDDDDDDDDEDADGKEGMGKAMMVPVFKRDMPINDEEKGDGKVVVGWRMPYDLPLVPYRDDEKPWCAAERCNEPDWMGRVWPGYGG